MAIVTFLGKDIKEYSEKYEEILETKTLTCPLCGIEHKLVRHDKYIRKIKDTGDEITIIRMICKNCRATFAILPDFLTPNKHYSTVEIEAVLLDSTTNTPEHIDTEVSISTVKRWINEFKHKTPMIISKLKMLILNNINLLISEIELSSHTVMEQLKILLEHLPDIENSGNTLGKVAIYLSASP